MRNIISVLVILLLMGCEDERTELITSYLQNYGSTETGVSFLLKNIRSMDNISAQDSLSILEVEYVRKKEKFIHDYHDLLLTSMSLKNIQKERSWIEASINDYRAIIDNFTNQIDSMENKDEVWMSELEKRVEKGNSAFVIQKQKQLLELNAMSTLIAKYKADPSAILARTAKVNYIVNRPGSSDSIQEVSRTFVFSGDNKSILKVI